MVEKFKTYCGKCGEYYLNEHIQNNRCPTCGHKMRAPRQDKSHMDSQINQLRNR